MYVAARCAVTALVLLGAVIGAPQQRQQRLIFSPSRRSDSFGQTSDSDGRLQSNLEIGGSPRPDVFESGNQFQFSSSDEDALAPSPSPDGDGLLIFPSDGPDAIVQAEADNPFQRGSSDVDDTFGSSSGRLIFNPERLIFSASRRRPGSPPPSPPPLAAPPSPSPLLLPAPSPVPLLQPSPPPSLPPPGEDGMEHLQAYIQQVRLSQAAGRSQQAQRIAAAAGRLDNLPAGLRPRVGPRTPEAVAANPEAAIGPRGEAGRSTTDSETSEEPPLLHDPAEDMGILDREAEAQDWRSNLLDSAARAGLRSPGIALDDDATTDDLPWPSLQTITGPSQQPAAEEAEDTVYGGAMHQEDLFYRGPLRGLSDAPEDGVPSSPPPEEKLDSYSPRPVTASAQLLEDSEAAESRVRRPPQRAARRLSAPSNRQPEYLADLVRLGTDFVYLPGLSGLGGVSAEPELNAYSQATGQSTIASTAPAGTELLSARPADGPNVVYVYIVRGDGQTLDLYAADARSAPAVADLARGQQQRTAAVVTEGDGRADESREGGVFAAQNEARVSTEDLQSSADSSGNLITVTDKVADDAASEGNELSPEVTSVTAEGEDPKIVKDRDSVESVYFDPANHLLLHSEAAKKVPVKDTNAQQPTPVTEDEVTEDDVTEDESASPELLPEERGIFFFPGNVIHSFGIAPSPAGPPVVVSVPRPGVPSRLVSVNQSTPIAELLTPPDQSLQTLAAAAIAAAAATASPVDRQDIVDSSPSPALPTQPPTVVPVSAPVAPAIVTARPLIGRPVIFTESPFAAETEIASGAESVLSSKFVFPGSSSQTAAVALLHSAASSAAGVSPNAVDVDAPFRFSSSGSGAITTEDNDLPGATSRPFIFSSGRPRPTPVAVAAETVTLAPVASFGGHCRPEPDCAVLSRRRRGCDVSTDCPSPQRCCFSQCLGVSVCQEGTYRERVEGLSALANVVVP